MRSKTGRSLKKFLSFLLTLSMVLGMLPTFALAGNLGEGTADHLHYTFDLLPHDVLKSDSTDTTDVDAVITIYGDGHSSVDALDLTVKLSVTPTSPATGAAREVTLVNVSGDNSNYAMTTGTASGSDFTVQKIDGAIVVTMEKVMIGVSPAATIAADFKVTVGGSDVVTAAVSEQAGLDVKHLLNDGSLYAAVTYDAPPTPIGKTVDLLTYVDIYTNAGGGTNATFSLKLGTDDATISKVNHATNGMITNSLDGYAVSNNVEHDVDVYWHRAGDRTVKNVLRSRGFFEWQTALKNLRPGDNAVSYILDDVGNWYTKNVGDITVHVPTCAVNVPSAVVSTADLVVTYQTEVKNGSVAVFYNGKTFTTGTDVDLSDGVAKITIPKDDLDTGWTSLYAVQTTESGVKSVPADATLNFVDEAFDVTFESGGSVYETQTVAKDGYASRPSDPTAPGGYKFAGWVTTAGGSTPFNFNTKITEPTTVYARFVLNTTPTIDVNFYVDGTAYETQTVVEGGYLSRPTDPVKPGYMFVDWVTTDGGDTSYNFSAPVSSATGNAYAKFASTGASRDVIFYWDDGTTVYEVQHVANGGHAVRPATPVKAGYEFVDWYADSAYNTKFNFGTAINDDGVKAYAKFEEVSKTYTVTYLVNGEYYAEKTGIAHNGTVPYKPASPKVDGYTFDGWYKTWTDNGDGVVEATELADEFTFGTGGTQVTADTTLYAKLTKIGKVTVTFDDGDTSQLITVPDNVIVDEGSSFVISNFVPERAGYIFKGWKEGTNTYAPGATYNVAVGATSVTLTAQWVADLVTVTAGTVGTGATLAGLPTVAITRGTEVAFTVTVAAGYDPAALVVKANGVALAYSAVNGNVYHYSFVANADTTITVSDLAELSYTVTMPVGDNFTAEFTDHATSKTVTHGDDYSFVVTPDAGYNIKGVYVNGVKQTATSTDPNTKAQTFKITNVTGPQTIEVSVDEIPVYTVTYVVNNAQYTTQKVSQGAKITTLPEDPVIDGYIFNGWFTEQDGAGTAVTKDTVVTGDMTVYAGLTAETYTVTYDGNGNDGGTVPGAQTKPHGVALNLSTAVPTKTGYKFLGWGTSATATVVSYQPGQTYSADENLNLYAVWEQLTFTVTLPSGTGFTVNALDSTTVAYGGNFEFQVIVDRAYAKTAPVVEVNGNPLNGTGATSDSTSATWTYKITGVKEDKQVAISVTMNPTHVVTFKTWLTDVDPTAANTTLYMTQKVENGYPAAQPAAPVVEGYTFGGWVWDDPATAETTLADYSFATLVNTPVTIVAKMLPIVPVVTWTDVTTPEDGWDITVDAADVTLVGETEPNESPNTVKYGSDMTFTVTIGEGWDASKMAVGANGLALAPVSIKEQSNKTVVYTYKLVNITADTTITVVGVVRKTVKITYSANADDDVSKMPGVQTVNSYVSGADDNGKIVNIIPSRVGYTFKGWAETPTATTVKYAKADIQEQNANAISRETSDTTLYAIWKADSTSITLAVSDTVDDTAANKQEYEGQKVTLTATIVAAPSTGSVIFYQSSDNGTTWTVISSQSANGSDKYTFEATTGAYSGTDTYKVAYKAESAEGYGSSNSNEVSVDRLSTTITWDLDGSNKVNGTDKLTVYDKDGAEVTSGIMEANNVYTLKIPTVKDLNGKPLTADKDYIVEWIYKDDKGVEREYTDAATGDYAVISAEYSQYQFRAVVTPVKDATRSVYNKAAGYNENLELTNDDAPALYTQWTVAVAREQTKTALTIEGAVNENQSTVIDGTTVDFGADHWAQFEGDKLVLKAAVTIEDETTPVSAGYVDFYRYNADDTWTKLNADPVAVDKNTGIATFGDDYNEAVLVKAYVDGTDSNAVEAKANVDKFFAVYLANATWATSASTGVTYTPAGAIHTVTAPAGDDVVYVKSTAIKTPVIDVKRGATVKGNTTYTTDLDNAGLTAGVDYTLTLRETGANTTDMADWSVVALDGRTVAETDYTIQWYTGTPTTDPAKVDLTMGTGATYSVENPAKDDYFYVELTAQNNMDKGEKSNKVIIDAKQDVNVSVVASDEIKSTAETDVYQLNMITLTATVTAKEVDAAEQPTDGLVGFYYQPYSGAKWVKIGESKALTTEDGKTFAEIETDVLPVDAAKNTKQTVKVLAVYEGNDTFNASHEVASDNSVSQKTTGTVEIEKVTVYSSVVFVDTAEENKKVSTNNGIIISANGALKANNADVTLTLSDIFTLDHDNATVNGVDLSKLKFNTDYTVQWWKLENASACQDKDGSGNTIFDSYADTAEWELIDGATNYQYKIDTVPQNVAYRAEITVTGTPITKGSDTEVVQAVAGRKVYYSNVLVVGDGMLTVTTNITTSANKNFNEEGIVKGETVTIHTLVAGATGSAPVCKLEATVKSVTDPSKSFTITADGGSYTSNGYCALTWDTAAAAVTPGYYTLTVKATSNNGYESQTVTRTLIVRDNDYTLSATKESKVYNGKAQGIDWKLTGVDIENDLAQKSVVVYYKQGDKLVEPTQVGTYNYELYLPASAYWTELTHVTGTFTIEQRPVSIADAVIQTKVYNGRDNVNVLEVMLGDAVTNSTTGLPSDDTGVIHGDSIYATATAALTSGYTAGTQTVTVTGDQELHGDDAHNYKWATDTRTYTEKINVQRSQVKGDIADSTFQYTGSNITVPADDIYLIDQAGNEITPADYTVTYYYHNGDGVEKVDAMNKLGKYTVIARPEQTNYKGGASQTVYVAATADDQAPDTTAKSALINITNTVELFGATTGIKASATNGATIKKIEYQNGTGWIETAPTAAGRYLVKVTASTGDTAYGIYTIVKARPELTLTADNATYTSAPYAGAVNGTYNGSTFPTGTYFTYTGGTIQGIAYEAPIEAGDYVVTAHVGETANYTAHEVSANFTIEKAKLTIDADELVRMQYESYPDMVATFKGLVGSTEAPDTSLRDVQIQPEFIFNEKNGGYTNAALDQVGADYPITVRNALSRNYEITYVGGNMAVNAQDANADLAIHGMIDNANGGDIAYYGDVIQLYAYGNYGDSVEGTGKRHNTSSLIKWSVNCSDTLAEIDSQDGLLKINGVGTFTVTLTRGSGTAAISTSIEIEALKKEVKVDVADQDKVYNGNSQDYNGAVTVKGLINGDTDDAILVAGGSRGPVGSQVVTYQVNTTKYQSEIYGGLFTINHKEVTVKPGVVTDVAYGDDLSIAENAYTVDGEVGSPKVNALNSGSTVVASVRELYNNLDVFDGYEILVTGTENINYNVTYLTKTDAGAEQPEDVKVTAKNLTFKTGVINSDGRTSGYMKSNSLFYKDEGFAITGETFTTTPVDRMYGEVNPVMDYALATLISGDSLADLATLPEWLVKFDYTKLHNIAEDANLEYPTPQNLMTGKSNYSIDSSMSFGNYTVSKDNGTQNIYQRPVTLALSNSQSTLDIYFTEILASGGAIDVTKLRNIIINNVEAGKYNNEGGLAELLKHTVKDLDLQVTTDFTTGDTQFTATVTVGNQNYWLGNAGQKFDITVNILYQRLTVDYTTFTATFSDVILYEQTETTRTPAYATGDVTFIIYRYVEGQENYSYYAANETAVVSELMTMDTSRTGRYYVTYPKLSAGTYRMFAVASGYTIID